MDRPPFDAEGDGQAARLVDLGGPDGLRATVTDHGATLVSLLVPAGTRAPTDVVCGFDTVTGYRSAANPYFGATVGRVANRIADARFELGGQTYQLAANEPPHHLHGGALRSLDKVRWEVVDVTSDAVSLTYRSPDGEEGYPGNLEVSATYRIEGDALTVTYQAGTDRPTPVNLTNHSYFNLAGAGVGDIRDHELTVLADRYSEVDAALIPSGQLLAVAGTALDLRTPRRLGDGIAALADVPGARGYDHNLVLDADGAGVLRSAATLSDPDSGLVLELDTDQRCLQVYSGNRMDPPISGKGGRTYVRYGAVCLEPQGFPDAVHHPQLPSTVLEPGQAYVHRARYRFTVR